MRDYKKIKAWQCADDLCVLIYEMTKNLPSNEIYTLLKPVEKEASI